MTFPFAWPEHKLTIRDLDYLSRHFAKTITEFLPCAEVSFLGRAGEGEGGEPGSWLSAGQAVAESWAAGANWVEQQRKPVLDAREARLFLPLWDGETVWAVAAVSGGSAALYQEPSMEWLLDRSLLVSRELRLLKRGSVDPATGFLNGQQLQEELALILAESPGMDALLLMELQPRAREAAHQMAELSRAGGYLDSLLGEGVALYHLGAGIHAWLWSEISVEESLALAESLLRRLKRQPNLVRVHVGIAALAAGPLPGGGEASPEFFIKRAWEALRTARRRGPYALCSAERLDRPDHPLRPPAASELVEFKKLWRGAESFTLLLLRLEGELAWERLAPLLESGPTLLPSGSGEAFVYLPGGDPGQGGAWARKAKALLAPLGVTLTVGCASYPCLDYRQAEIPGNARKALWHAGFLGGGAIAVFDGVTLNISGDVYFNEGDLARAIKEYRQGLRLDPGNRNIMNSLAVVYAQMNRSRLAAALFEQVLAIDGGDLMALFNLGFIYLRRQEGELALACFERALALDRDNFDLLLQTGQLYCQSGKYSLAIEVLSRAEKNTVAPSRAARPGEGTRGNLGHGLVYRYLGEAYRGDGQYGPAMTCLERATRYNPRDAAALSLLGEVYRLTGQGVEIAESLCRQAVELDVRQWEHWYRLAAVLAARGDYPGARAALNQSLRLRRYNGIVLELLAQVYEQEGQPRRAAAIRGRLRGK